MNFFGHAVVAAWTDDGASHLLGSMLPDFEGMTGVPLLGVDDPDVQRGIDLHHRTDHRFHRARSFIALCERALEDMTKLKIRRGTARAVAHVGSELFLDGLLAKRPEHVDRYLDALEAGPRLRLDWKDRGHAFARLHSRLSLWGAPKEYAEPAFVLDRLVDSLGRRPALAPTEEETKRLEEFLPRLRQRTENAALELLDELRSGLGIGS